MLEQRVRLPLLAALESTEDSGVSSFAIVVNPDIESDVLQIPLPENSVAEIFAESLEPPPSTQELFALTSTRNTTSITSLSDHQTGFLTPLQ